RRDQAGSPRPGQPDAARQARGVRRRRDARLGGSDRRLPAHRLLRQRTARGTRCSGLAGDRSVSAEHIQRIGDLLLLLVQPDRWQVAAVALDRFRAVPRPHGRRNDLVAEQFDRIGHQCLGTVQVRHPVIGQQCPEPGQALARQLQYHVEVERIGLGVGGVPAQHLLDRRQGLDGALLPGFDPGNLQPRCLAGRIARDGLAVREHRVARRAGRLRLRGSRHVVLVTRCNRGADRGAACQCQEQGHYRPLRCGYAHLDLAMGLARRLPGGAPARRPGPSGTSRVLRHRCHRRRDRSHSRSTPRAAAPRASAAAGRLPAYRHGGSRRAYAKDSLTRDTWRRYPRVLYVEQDPSRMLRDSPERYGLVTRLLHWSMAVLVLLQFVKFGDRLGQGRYWLVETVGGWHTTVGTLLLVLVLVRIAWAFVQRRNRPVNDPALAIFVTTGHVLLYAALL